MPIDDSEILGFVVDPHWNGLRLDHYLKAMIPAMSRSKLQKRIREGRILVDGAVRYARFKVRSGQRVVFDASDPDSDPEEMRGFELSVLYEDEDLLAVEKPSGLHVHPVAGHRHDTLLNALRWYLHDRGDDTEAVDLAHRLDKVTSGIVVATKDRSARRSLQEAFEAHNVAKEYYAVAEGHFAEDAGIIDLPLMPNLSPRAVEKTLVHPEGKPSRTRFEVLRRIGEAKDPDEEIVLGEYATALRLRPESGRQHQLRVHCAALGHPLVGDDRYGTAPPRVLSGREFNRCALHAHRLSFAHPRDGRRIELESEVPRDLRFDE